MSVLTDLIPGSQLLDAIGRVIDRVVPDASANAAAKNALAAAQQSGDLSIDLANLQINLADTQSKNWFQSAWRPALAWACVLSFVYHFLIYPLAGTYVPEIKDIAAQDFGIMMGVLTILIGARSFDKNKGTDTP